MRRTPLSLPEVRKELVEIGEELIKLQGRLEAVRDCVTDSLTLICGEERPAIAALAEEELIEKIAGRVAARLESFPVGKKQSDNRYVRDMEAATYLGVRVATLRSWRSRGEPCGPPVTRMGRMVMYSMKALEKYMEERTAGTR